MVVAVGVASLDAKVPVMDQGEWRAANAGDATVGHLDIEATADAAVAAGGLHDGVGWGRADAINVRDRPCRTVVHTRAARDAGAVRKTPGRTKDEVRCRTAPCESINELPLNFIASMEASAAVDAE